MNKKLFAQVFIKNPEDYKQNLKNQSVIIVIIIILNSFITCHCPGNKDPEGWKLVSKNKY